MRATTQPRRHPLQPGTLLISVRKKGDAISTGKLITPQTKDGTAKSVKEMELEAQRFLISQQQNRNNG